MFTFTMINNNHTSVKKKTCCLLWLVVWRLTDAEQLLFFALLASFTLHADVVVHFLGFLFRDTHTVAVVPVCAQVAADVEPVAGQ